MNRTSTMIGLVVLITAPGFAAACGAKVERQAVAVELTCSEFQESNHRLSYRDGVLMTIDGLRYSGTDGTVPKVEIRSLQFSVGGARFVAPYELLRTLYEPHVPPRTMNTLSIQQTADLVFAQFSGGDGAGGYTAMWVLNVASGELTRLLYQQPDPSKANIVRAKLKPNPGVHTDAQDGGAPVTPTR